MIVSEVLSDNSVNPHLPAKLLSMFHNDPFVQLWMLPEQIWHRSSDVAASLERTATQGFRPEYETPPLADSAHEQATRCL